MATGGVPIRYFPLLYAGFAAVALFIIFLIANRLHFHVAVTTHCSTKLTIEQEASFRNWRWDSEFLPSISSASGDHLPERPLWRIALACAVGFLVVGHYHAYLLYRKGDGARPGFTLSHAFLVSLVAKVVSGFGYNFIASFEHWTFHTYSFAVYIFCGFAMQLIHVALTRRYQHLIPNNQGAISLRTKTICLVGQTLCAAGVGKFFVLDHVGACIHGAYSRSNMCEWTFSLFNLAFDATVYFDLGDQRLVTTCSGAGGGDDEKESITAGATNTTTTVPNLLPNHVGTWRSWPSQGLLWAADVAAAYFAVSGLIQMLKQVYFIPMVAMRFTPEAIMGVTLPVATLIATRIPAVRSVLMPTTGDKSLSDLIALQRWIVVVTICAAFALFHADILISAEMKIVVSGIAPHLLFAVFRLRALCVSSKAATLGKIAEGADRHDVNTEALVASVVHEQHRLAYSMGFGFVGCMAARFWGLSLDPLMIDPIWNAYFLVGFVVLQFAGPLRQYSVELIALNRQHVPLVPATASSMSAAAAFGFLLGLSLMVASSSETTARYVGVDPLGDWWAPPATILAVLGGVVFSERLALLGASASPKRSAFTALCVAMSLGALVLYYGTTQSDWYYQMNPRVLEKWALKPRSGSPAFAFLGGLVLQFCIGALWPRVFAWHMGLSQTVVADSIQAAAALEHHHHDSPALLSAPKVDTVAYLCNASVLVGNIYCAVFPFVPGGFLMRNRMDIVLFGAVFGVLVFVSRLAQSTESGAVRVTSRGATPRVSTVGRLFAGLVLVLVIGRQLAWEDAPDPTVVTPDGHSSVNVTGAIWTIHFTDDDYGVDSLPRMIKMLKEHKPNIIGFLESDAHRVVSANRDITMHVAYQMGYRYSDYGPTALDGTFGCAMISQFPIEEVERMVLPSPLGELACMIRAKVRVLPSPAPLVNVYVGHWGNTQHVQDVVLQSEVLRDMALKYSGPSFFLGYLVTAPGHRNYYRFVQSDGVEEDAVMNRGGEDDDTKVWPEERDGIRLPQIPIVKKRDTLFRDAGRDLNRGRNPFFRGPVTPQQHAAQRSRDDKELAGATWAPSLYWRVHAIPKDYTDKSIALEGRVASRELQQQYVVTQLDAAALANLRTGRHENGTVVYGGNAKSARELHLERLQRAAEYKARHLTLTDGLAIKPDPAKLREFAAEYELLEKEMKLVYEFPNTGRVQMRHPRREYDDRYCQYILYRSIPLLDWYRVLNMDEISDTELMVVRFSLSTDPNFAATSAVALAEKP